MFPHCKCLFLLFAGWVGEGGGGEAFNIHADYACFFINLPKKSYFTQLQISMSFQVTLSCNGENRRRGYLKFCRKKPLTI